MTRLRPAILLSLLAALVALVAGCAGGSDDQASASTDVNELLKQTFSGSKEIESGKLDLKIRLEAQGGDSQLDGPVDVSLTGPFRSADGGKLPEFKLDADFEGAGESIEAGITSTGDKGFVSFQGTDYVLEHHVFEQFKAGYEQARKQGSEGEEQSLATLGMDPRKWLTDPKNEGDAKVGDEDTIKITGGVDVARLLDDVDKALEQASSLGLQGAGRLPEQLTAEQKRQVTDAVRDPRVEIYTGKEDTILRRMLVDFGVADARGTTGKVAFDVSITDLNEDQDVAEPADAKPFGELLDQLGGLGAPGGAAASGGAAAAPGASSSEAEFERFSECVTEAGDDAAAAHKCADLLNG